jgi:hypothetical protein
VDIVVNNAGIAVYGTILDVAEKDFRPTTRPGAPRSA